MFRSRRTSDAAARPTLGVSFQKECFSAYRRISTMIFVPLETYNASIEMVTMDPRHLQEALDRDANLIATEKSK